MKIFQDIEYSKGRSMITLLPILAKEQSRIIINTVLVLMNPKHWIVAKGRHLFSHGGVCCKQ